MLDGQRSELLRSSECDPRSASITGFTPKHSGLSLQSPLRLYFNHTHLPQPPQHPDCMCSLLSPPAAVYLIHDPTIIRESPAGPFLARGDTHGDNKIYLFQRNICKWRAGCEAKPPPPCFTKKYMVNILLGFI